MPITAFSIGRDAQLVIVAATGRVDLSHVTGFESRQLTHAVLQKNRAPELGARFLFA